MAVARHPVARIAPPAPAIISASRARVGERYGATREFSADPSVPPGATTVSGRERDRAQSAVTIPERHGCRWVAASVVLVAPRRVATIIAGAAPNPRRRPIATNKPSTPAAADHRHCHTERRTSCWRRSSTPQVDLACSSLSTGSRSAQRAMPSEPPSPQLLKPDGCRAPPRSSHRAAGARHHQRLARASG